MHVAVTCPHCNVVLHEVGIWKRLRWRAGSPLRTASTYTLVEVPIAMLAIFRVLSSSLGGPSAPDTPRVHRGPYARRWAVIGPCGESPIEAALYP
jgi:hypothetical protein